MHIPRSVLALLLAAGVALGFFFAPTAQAQGDRARGWTVVQDGKTGVYPHGDRWSATATPTGMTFENGGTGEKVYYYGTFRVDERPRDLK